MAPKISQATEISKIVSPWSKSNFLPQKIHNRNPDYSSVPEQEKNFTLEWVSSEIQTTKQLVPANTLCFQIISSELIRWLVQAFEQWKKNHGKMPDVAYETTELCSTLDSDVKFKRTLWHKLKKRRKWKIKLEIVSFTRRPEKICK